jgi:hypothetical protein
MPGYRLVEVGGGRMGANMLPHVYADLGEACDAGERLLDALAPYPHRRPHTVQVVDVWTREVVTRITPYTDRDRDVCVACGQPDDPFGPVEQDLLPPPPGGSAPPPAAASAGAQGGHAGPGTAENEPFAEPVLPSPPGGLDVDDESWR